jgi:hypothetical protein
LGEPTLRSPAAIAAVLTVLAKTLSDAQQRSSKESLLEWLSQAPSQEPFKGDDRALRGLLELQQSLIFERAFGLKAESKVRSELLQFAQSRRESMRFKEVLDAGRLVTRLPLRQSQSSHRIKAFRLISRTSKPFGYFYIVLGYFLFNTGMFLANVLEWSGRLELASFAVGLVFGGLVVVIGMYMLKQGRRFEIAAEFLGWRSEADQSSTQAQSMYGADETSGAA